MVQCTLYNIQCTMYNIQYTLCSVLTTVKMKAKKGNVCFSPFAKKMNYFKQVIKLMCELMKRMNGS